MQTLLSVDAKIVGRKQPLVHGLQVLLAQVEDSPSLRAIISRVVVSQVQAFHERQADRRLTRFLTQAQIETAAQSGKIEMGGQDLDQKVDIDQAIATALQAFQDGLYMVFVDGTQFTNLDAPVPLQAHSQMTFVRLMLLAGG